MTGLVRSAFDANPRDGSRFLFFNKSSALRSDLDVYAYIKSVLDTLLAGSTDYAALRPDLWAQRHPEAIRDYRKDERRDRVNAKTIRREHRRLRP